MIENINTGEAPAAIGPYSQAVIHGNTLYLSGQIPLDPCSGELVQGDIAGEVRRVCENLRAVVEAAGTVLENTLKVTVYLTDLSHFAKVNEVYAEYFGRVKPARSTVEVRALPKGARVEMDLIAALDGSRE